MRRYSAFGWLELIIGLLLIGLGIFTFVNPDSALSGFVFLYGIAAVIMGIADLILYIKIERFLAFRSVVSLVAGILSVMSGFMLLVYPNAGKWILAMLFPIWFIAHCISRLSHLFSVRIMAGTALYYFTLIINVIGLLLGILMIFHPMFTLLSSISIASLYLILLGIDGIVMTFSRIGR